MSEHGIGVSCQELAMGHHLGLWCAAQVVAMLSTVEVSKLQPELLDECLEHLANLLQDQSYAARRHGATIIPLLYGKWSDVQVV